MVVVFLAVSVLLFEEFGFERVRRCCSVVVYCGILWSMVYISMDYYNNNKGDI